MSPMVRWMSAAWVGLLLCAGIASVPTASAQAGQEGGTTATAPAQQPPYTLAEYNDYQKANNEKDPEAKIKLLDDFVSKYPSSALLPYVYRAYYLSYYQLKNYAKTLEYVDKLLALGSKVDLGSRLEAQIARAQAYFIGSSDKALQTPQQYTAARDAAVQGLATLSQWQKPSNMTDEQFAAQKKSIGILLNSVAGVTEAGLKDYKAAQDSYKAALAIDPNDAMTHYRLGLADIQATPPSSMDGYWELARSMALNKQGEAQVRPYLRAQLVNYQQLGCDKLVDDELGQLLTMAAAGNARPATFTIPSAADLKKVQDDTADFIPWLQEGGEHGKMMWLATCGLEFPDVQVRVLDNKPGDGGNATLEVYRSSATDPDAAQKEMEAATVPNMEVHVVGQPDVKRVQKDDYVRFTGTLSGYQQSPFLITWTNAKVNTEDIPADKAAPGAKRPPVRRPAPKPASR